jgi:hypothetical protein
MRHFAPFLALALFACGDVTLGENTSLASTSAAISGTVFDGESAPEGELVIALATENGDSLTVVSTLVISAVDLPHRYEFDGLQKDVRYRLIALDGDTELDGLTFADDLLLAATVDSVRIGLGEDNVGGVNLAL